jgi:putative N6-adenine-specific DNA methylase
MDREEFKLVATCFYGFEEVLAEELKELGAKDIEVENRAVSFTSDKKFMYEVNYKLRTAIKVLKPIHSFMANNEDELYDGVMSYDWTTIFKAKNTFKVDSVVNSDHFNHSQFVALKTKDAIVDQFKQKEDRRPFIDKESPDFRVSIRINGTKCTLSLDSSGASLFKRGYRISTQDAPLNEVVAASLIKLSGWKYDSNFIDPMCGSGTFLIEAAMQAYDIPAGVFREEFGFQQWNDYDEDLFDDIIDSCEERDFDYEIIGFDKSIGAITSARHNVTRAFLENKITLRVENFFEAELPTDKGIIVTNPPYGERLDKRKNMPELYKNIGDAFKQNCIGYDAWVLSGNTQAMKYIGLRPSVKHKLFNGSLDCLFNKFEIYQGSKKESKN